MLQMLSLLSCLLLVQQECESSHQSPFVHVDDHAISDAIPDCYADLVLPQPLHEGLYEAL